MSANRERWQPASRAGTIQKRSGEQFAAVKTPINKRDASPRAANVNESFHLYGGDVARLS
jgi:hypothetical protein